MNMAGKLHRNGSPVRVYHAAEVLAGMAMRLPSARRDERANAHLHPLLPRARRRSAGRSHAEGRDRPHDRHGRAQARRRAGGFFRAVRRRPRPRQADQDHVIEHFDHYLLEFERNAIASGAEVHWASSADEASRIVVDLCRNAQAKRVTRVKSMLGGDRPPPHAGCGRHRAHRNRSGRAHRGSEAIGRHTSSGRRCIARREQVSGDVQRSRTASCTVMETIEAMVGARRELRDKFLSADVSISGANFLIADTGATCTVTNEGNAELTTSPPRVRIVTAGIELVPSLPHAFALRLLVRSATGADVTQYTTFHCGPKKPGDLDGPEEFHIVLVDNGRTKMLAEAGLRDMLRCLRCGAMHEPLRGVPADGRACLWRHLSRADGAVLTPVFDGLENPAICRMRARSTASARRSARSTFRCRRCCAAGATARGAKGWNRRRCASGWVSSPSWPRPWLYNCKRRWLFAYATVQPWGLDPQHARLGPWAEYRDFPAPEGPDLHGYTSGEGRASDGARRHPGPGSRRARATQHRCGDCATRRRRAADGPAIDAAPTCSQARSWRSLHRASHRRRSLLRQNRSRRWRTCLPRWPRTLEIRRLPAVVALQPLALLRSLDWSAFEVHAQVAPDESAAVGIWRSGVSPRPVRWCSIPVPDSPVLANFLPLHHIVLLRGADIPGVPGRLRA